MILLHPGRVSDRSTGLSPVRIRFQHRENRPTSRIICDILRQSISSQSDISVNSHSDGHADGVTSVRCQRGSQQAIRVNAVEFNAANPTLRKIGTAVQHWPQHLLTEE